MITPPRINRGDPITALWLNQVRDCVKELQDQVLPKKTKKVAGGSSDGALQPFEVYIGGGSGTTAWRTIQIHTGNMFKATSATAIVPGGLDGAAVYWILNGQTTSNIHVDIPYSVNSAGITIGTPGIAITAGSGWSGYPNTIITGHWYIPIATVLVTGNDNSSNKSTSINQIQYGDVHLDPFIIDASITPNPDANNCLHILKVI